MLEDALINRISLGESALSFVDGSRKRFSESRLAAENLTKIFVFMRDRSKRMRLKGRSNARSDLLISLVKAGASGDRRLMRSTVEAIVAEERSKQHNILADRLVKAMNGLVNGAANMSTPRRTTHQEGLSNRGPCIRHRDF
jgi:hypothetical protein